MKEFSDNVLDTFADFSPNKAIQRVFYTCLEEVPDSLKVCCLPLSSYHITVCPLKVFLHTTYDMHNKGKQH